VLARTGHPFDGQRLRVVPGASPRRDGRIHVLLPDGNAALLPLAWFGETASSAAGGGAEQHFSADGLRRLLRLVDRLRGMTG